MPKIKCEIPQYIDRQTLPQEEKVRLSEINLEIFQKLKDSGYFRIHQGKLVSKKQSYFDAKNLAGKLNKEYNAKVVVTDDMNIRGGASDLVARVNVLPLKKIFEPLTEEQLENREALRLNEPFVRPETIRVHKFKGPDDDADISEESYKELQEGIYGKGNPNQIILFQGAPINYSLKAAEILNTPAAQEFFKKVQKNNITGDAFWSKMQSDLKIPSNQIELLKQLTPSTSTSIKPGVSELFESNPELANAVYEALGFTQTVVTEIGTVFKEPSKFSKEDYDTLKDMGYTEDEILDKLGAKKSETVLAKKMVSPEQQQRAQQLYSQYLDTIFPDSKVKDIVYHGANEPIEGENFTKREGATGGGIWFSGSKKYAQIQMDRAQPSESLIGRKLRGAPTMYRVVLNIKNPKNFYNATGSLLVQTPREFEKQYDRKTNDAALFHHPNSKKPASSDSADQIVVFEPEQIHILGSKKDIEGFKKFKPKPSIPSREELIAGLLANYSYTVEVNVAYNTIQNPFLSEDVQSGQNAYGLSLDDFIEAGIEQGQSAKTVVNDIGNLFPKVDSEWMYFNRGEYVPEFYGDEGPSPITTKEEVYQLLQKEIDEAKDTKTPTAHYSNMTTPGGTKYKELRIVTPQITPSIKGHAQFAEANDIGWARVDDKTFIHKQESEGISADEYWALSEEDRRKAAEKANSNQDRTKTLRVLEVQSDLFQKGRGKEELVIDRGNYNRERVSREELNEAEKNGNYEKVPFSEMKWVDENQTGGNYLNLSESERVSSIWAYKYNNVFYMYDYKLGHPVKFVKTQSAQNQFLQLLNKDNAWVTFFVKSLVQDAARKGYENILFPSGDTASKVEGHTTLENFKRQKEDRIQTLSGKISVRKNTNVDSITSWDIVDEKNNVVLGNRISEESASEGAFKYIKEREDEINQLKQELERIEKEGFGALRPIWKFYEETVTNILKKQGYNPTVITDEYGNTWNSVVITESMKSDPVLLQEPSHKMPAYQTIANNKTISKVKGLLEKLGVRTEIVNGLLQKHGVNAIAHLSQKLIEISAGLENQALTEEMMHMITAMIPEDVYDDLAEKIQDYKIFKQTLFQYSNYKSYQNPDGTPNIRMIQMEAIGKLLAEYYILNSENLSKEEVNVAKTLWARILDWIKDIFGAYIDPFQQLINDLENGTLELYDDVHFDEHLYQAANLVTEDNLNKLAEELQKDKNQQTFDKLGKMLTEIKSEDIKVLYNNAARITGYDKTDLAFTRARVQSAVNASDITDKLKHTIGHIRSLYTLTEGLASRAAEIERLLNGDLSENNPDDDLDIRRLNKDLYNMKVMAAVLKEEEVTYSQLFSTLTSDGTKGIMAELNQTLNFVAGNIDAVNKIFNRQSTKNFEKIIDEENSAKLKQWKATKEKELRVLTDRKIKNPSNRALAAQIKQIEKELKDPPFSGKKVLEMLTNPNNTGLSKLFHFLYDGPLTNKRQEIQTVSNLIRKAVVQSEAVAQQKIETLKDDFEELFKRRGRPTDYDAYFSRYLETVDRVYFNYNTGELESYKEVRLLSRSQQWRFENDIETLKHKRHQLELSLKEPGISEETKNDLESQLKNVKDQLNKLFKNFAMDRYTDEYYKIYDLLKVELTEPGPYQGMTVREVRQNLLDKIKDKNGEITALQNPYETEAILQEIDKLLFDLQRLSSERHVDGSMKTGNDLVIAKTIKEFQKQKRDNEVDTWYMTKSSEVRWREQKEEIDRELQNAIALLDQNPGIVSIELKYEEVKKRRDLWYKMNARDVVSDKFYEDREEITTRISNILSKYGSSDDRLDDLWYDMFELTKGYRDIDGAIKAHEISDEAMQKIMAIEKKIEYLKALSKESNKISKEDKKELIKQIENLENLQTTSTNKYWDEEFAVVKSHVEKTLRDRGINRGDMDYNRLFARELQSHPFVKNNTIDISEKTQNPFYKAPAAAVKIGAKLYMPLYPWRHTAPNDPGYILFNQPTRKWETYEVNKKYHNQNHDTLTGTAALDPDKADAVYGSLTYANLSREDKEWLEKIRSFYHETQKKYAKSQRLGDALPRVQAEGLQRTKQRLNNLREIEWKQIFSKASIENLFNLTGTEKEMVYGEGKVLSEREKGNVQIYAKYTNRNIPPSRQDRNLFKVLALYTAESEHYSKMWDLLPILSTAKTEAGKNLDKKGHDKTSYSLLQREIDRQINRQTRYDEGVTRLASNVSDSTMRWLGFLRLGLPWQMTLNLKNVIQNLWQVFMNHMWLKNYSKGSIMTAMGHAIPKAASLYKSTLSDDENKYVTIVKRLKLIDEVSIARNAEIFAGSKTITTIDNWKTILGSVKGSVETFTAILMYELLKQDYRINGIHIEDMYDYVDGVLTPKEGMTPDEEYQITTRVFEMNQFVQGNFSLANSPMMKAYWAGRVFSFMKNWFYNGYEKQFGKRRILNSGVETEGNYRIFWSLLTENPLSILSAKGLTANEKAGLFGFYMNFLAVNVVGASLYALERSLKESGDDDDEAPFQWYALLLGRKVHAEMASYNYLDKGIVVGEILTGKRNVAYFGNNRDPITKAFGYVGFNNILLPFLNNAVMPVDHSGFAWNSKIRTDDPFYKRFKDSILTYNLMKALSLRNDMVNPEKAFKGYEYYSETWLADYEKDNKKK